MDLNYLRDIWSKNNSTRFIITRKTKEREKHPIAGAYEVHPDDQPEPFEPFRITSLFPSLSNPDILVITNDMKNAYSSVIELAYCTYCGADIRSDTCTNCGCKVDMEINNEMEAVT